MMTPSSRLSGTAAQAVHEAQQASIDVTDLYPHGITPLTQGVPADEILRRLGGPDGVTVAPLDQPSAFVKPRSVFFHLDGTLLDRSSKISIFTSLCVATWIMFDLYCFNALSNITNCELKINCLLFVFLNPTFLYVAGKKRRWDMVSSHPSVAILLYHTTRRAFLLVRQFRPAVYATAMRTATEAAEAIGASPPAPLPLTCGFTFELCAGIVGDKPDLSLIQTAQEEILEETGFDVPHEKIKKVTSFLSAVGISGSRQTIFAAEVDDSMLAVQQDGVGGGLAEHGEAIEVVALPVDSLETFLMDESLGKSAGLLFALMWGKSSGMFPNL